MLPVYFVIIGVIINCIGGISYLLNTLKGKVKPNRVTWLLWALAPLIAFSAELKQDVGLQSLMTFIVGFNPLLIFIASFVNKKSEWKISRFDIICGIFSVLGLLLWYMTKVGNIAIFFSILADGMAGLPTIVKSFHAPETESSQVFLLSAISALITLLTVRTWNFATYGFPVYILLMSFLLFVLIQFKIGKKIKAFE